MLSTTCRVLTTNKMDDTHEMKMTMIKKQDRGENYVCGIIERRDKRQFDTSTIVRIAHGTFGLESFFVFEHSILIVFRDVNCQTKLDNKIMTKIFDDTVVCSHDSPKIKWVLHTRKVYLCRNVCKLLTINCPIDTDLKASYRLCWYILILLGVFDLLLRFSLLSNSPFEMNLIGLLFVFLWQQMLACFNK
jgi:hypothetical protein